MKKVYLQKINNKKSNVAKAMVLFNNHLIKYTKVGNQRYTDNVLIYNFWLQVDVVVSSNEYNYIVNKLQLV